MINIDERLEKIAEMICGKTIADIGSDHGYLPIWLCENKIIKKAYAIEISGKCAEKIKYNIKKHKIPENIIIPIISDGFSNFKKNFDFGELDDIVIAGMGGETIAAILEKTKTICDIKNKNIILQPNSKIETLKKYLKKNNYTIDETKIIECKKRFYTIIKTKYTG